MSRSVQCRFVRLAGVALVPAVLLCCAGKVQAECGDYVRIHGLEGTVPPVSDHDPTPADCPCHGPECSGAPELPTPVPPAPPTHPAPKGLVCAAGGDPDNRTATRFDAEPGRSPVRQLTSIFHPPRV